MSSPSRKTTEPIADLQDMGARFVRAWKKAEQGGQVKDARLDNPPHPGEILAEDVLPALGLSVTRAAEQLGVSRVALSRVLNGRAAISPEMALRIEAWLGKERGGDARHWLRMQSEYDMWQTEQRLKGTPLNVQPAPKSNTAA